uniref:RimK-related lysine biosynthesis protein, Probable-dependent amine/thiol ligase family Amino-group n=1 Tax=Podoviridae sp. ctJDl18 TaxID=2825242 RepID=A0A8S5V0Y2_9CAUD|nr:MAG TPA: RimK-related lysine biosynthesis protein, Probable-dependent amine/thiol ligase family Amino-group [Podoviridae sp. ctJDl18]DAP07190.1 MAG TPA: RimK-related lysine biosynthesis protein, Probable-dependent amine/thiol ligase family Amino-group [Caudoviricetes sp.]
MRCSNCSSSIPLHIFYPFKILAKLTIKGR